MCVSLSSLGTKNILEPNKNRVSSKNIRRGKNGYIRELFVTKGSHLNPVQCNDWVERIFGLSLELHKSRLLLHCALTPFFSLLRFL